MHTRKPRIAIVGGGFSGLCIAYMIEQLAPGAADLVVVEASDRLGGRVHTRTIGPDRTRYDAGAAELYDHVSAPLLLRFVARLGLATRPLEATPVFFWEGARLDDEADIERVLGPDGVAALDAFWAEGTRLRPPSRFAAPGFDFEHPWSRQNFAQVLASIQHPGAERFVRAQINSDLAEAPEDVNGVLAFDNLVVDHPSYCNMFTLRGGNARLIDQLAEASRATLRMNAAVAHVQERDGAFALTLSSGASIACDAVALTLPPDRFDGLTFDLASPLRPRDPYTVIATYLRVTLAFKRRFWAPSLSEDYIVNDAFQGCTVYDQSPRGDAAGVGILSWLLAGPEAEARMNMESKALAREVVESACATGMLDARDVAEHWIDTRVDRWPACRTPTPGQAPALTPRTALPDHRLCASDRLVIATDCLYDGTLNGALEGAVRAVAILSEGLGLGVSSEEAIMRRLGLTEDAQARIYQAARAHLPFVRNAHR